MKNELKLSNRLEDVFFYAFEDIKFYDDTIDLVCPYYQLMHKMCVDLVTHRFAFKPITMLDIGAGTGAESLRIMSSNTEAKILAVDLSAEMKKKFMSKAKQYLDKKSFEKHIQYLVDDFTDLPNDELLKRNGNKKFDLVITAYTIHHYERRHKKEIYKKVANLLTEGGMFISIDLFNYLDAAMSQEAHKFDIKWITDKFENPDSVSQSAMQIPLETRMKLKEKWIQHYEQDNILDPYETQREFLIAGGISQVEMPFRFYQNGLLCAEK